MKRNILFAAAVAMMSFAAACTPEDGTADVTLSASPASVTIPADGGTVPVVITTNQDSFGFAGGADWLTVTQDGKSLSFSAEANEDTENDRTCTVTVTAGGKTLEIPVTQPKGSKYPGYAEVLAVEEALYSGTLYQTMGMASGEGGLAMIVADLDARNRLVLEFFTDGFASADEVTLPAGSYTLAEDPAEGMMYAAEPMTFNKGVANVVDEGTEDEETLYMGSYIETTIGDAVTNDMITGGTFSVEDNSDGTKVLKFDFTTESGASCKYYYEGVLDIDTSQATFPGDEEEPVEVSPVDVTSVSGSYNGAMDENGDFCNIILTLNTVEDGYPSTSIDFNIPYLEYTDDIDLSGTYSTIDTPYTSKGINKGASEASDMGTLAYYTYITLSMDFVMVPDFQVISEYFIADGESTMTLTKNADGTYDITASLKNAAGESYDYDIKGMAIELSDWSSMDDEDYGEDW